MACGANFKIEVFNTSSKSAIWSTSVNFRHDSDLCEKCMANDLEFSVYDRKCTETDTNKGLIVFFGKIAEDDFFKIYEIDQQLVTEIKNSGNCTCKIKKIECTCDEGNFPSDSYFVYKSCKENLYFYINDDFDYSPNPSGLSENEQTVYELKSQIMQEGYSSSDNPPLVSPSTIALILLDELNRLDGWDTLQELQGNIPLVVFRNQSYGMSQMYPETLADLIDSGHYPPVSGYNGDVDSFFQKRSLYLEIMEDKNSPKLIGAFIRKSIEHWAKGTDGTNSKLKDGKNPAEAGFDISELHHVLATLYAKGYRLPVHDNPGGLKNRWDNIANTTSMLYTINKKMGIPNAPARFIDIAPLGKDGSSFMCLEYNNKVQANVNKNSTSEFIDAEGRRSRYLAPYSVASDPMFRRTQSQCEMCK